MATIKIPHAATSPAQVIAAHEIVVVRKLEDAVKDYLSKELIGLSETRLNPMCHFWGNAREVGLAVFNILRECYLQVYKEEYGKNADSPFSGSISDTITLTLPRATEFISLEVLKRYASRLNLEFKRSLLPLQITGVEEASSGTFLKATNYLKVHFRIGWWRFSSVELPPEMTMDEYLELVQEGARHVGEMVGVTYPKLSKFSDAFWAFDNCESTRGRNKESIASFGGDPLEYGKFENILLYVPKVLKIIQSITRRNRSEPSFFTL